MDIYGTWVVTEVAWAALATATRAEAEAAEAAEEAERVVAIWQNAEVMRRRQGERMWWQDWKNTNWIEAREEAETARAQAKVEWAKAKTCLRS